jgi:catechol 2,3-dioxygenase-like lactoylglutathione lyase family enzyme
VLADMPCYTILLSTDLDTSRHFYHDVLGLEVVREDPGPDVEPRIVFRTANGRLILSKSTVGTSDSQTQMAWIVPDIRAAVADLRARGVKIEEYSAPDPVTVDGVADMGYSLAAWFIDPSQNCLAVVEPKA